MTENLKEKNAKYFQYLLEIGVIDQEDYFVISKQYESHTEKQLLFDISNIFSNFTASDWYDLSCRIYQNWQKIFSYVEGQNLSYQQQKSEPIKKSSRQLPKDNENGQPCISTISHQPDKKIINENEIISKKGKRGERTYSDLQASNNVFERFEIEEKLGKLSNIILKKAYQTNFDLLKGNVNKRVDSSYDVVRSLEEKPQSSRQNERLSNLERQDCHSKLYNYYFKKRAETEMKRELRESTELDGCTFVPQINPIDKENLTLLNTLKVPVYERLLRTKPVPANIILEKQEYRELKGATFHPDISKSQRLSKSKNDLQASPEDRKRNAVERLYGDAQIKEKIMYLKQMNRKELETEGCTFSPTILSPSKNADSFSKLELSKSFDRLYEENIKRHRKMLKKEVEIKEQELGSCTFQPDRPARNYKIKNETDFNDLAAHERLYERFKRRREKSTQPINERYGSPPKENSSTKENNRYRSYSVLQEKTPNKSPKVQSNENNSISTPAYDRLYRDMTTRKIKLEKLREKVNKEQGATFKPKTNWSKQNYRSISAAYNSSQEINQPLGYDIKYSEGGYLQENALYDRRESENLSLRTLGQTHSPSSRRMNDQEVNAQLKRKQK